MHEDFFAKRRPGDLEIKAEHKSSGRGGSAAIKQKQYAKKQHQGGRHESQYSQIQRAGRGWPGGGGCRVTESATLRMSFARHPQHSDTRKDCKS